MDIKQTLLDFHNTLKSSPEISDDELLNKFPQIGKDNLSAAFDYSATIDSGKYKTEDEFVDKFPEFFPVKKKEQAVDGGTLPEVVVTASKQSTPPSSPTSTSASVSAPSPLPLGVEPVVTEEMKERYKRVGSSTGSLNSIIEQKKKSDPTFAPKASEFIRSAYDLNQQGKGTERTGLLYDFFSKNSDLQTNKNTREAFISSSYAGVYNSQSPDLIKEYDNSEFKGVLTGRQFNGLKSLSFGKQSEYTTAIQKLNDPNTSDVEKEAVKLELDVIGADIDQDAAATMINQNKNLPVAVDLFNKAKDEKIAAQERLRQIDYENPYTARAFGNIVTNAIDRGTKVGETADILNVTAENSGIDIARLAELQKLQQDAKATKLYEEFSNNPSFELFKKNPIGILLELSLESMSALYSHGASRMAAGAATGATLGSVVPGIGTVAGASSGVLGGLGVSSLNLEYSGKIMEGLSERGVDITNASDLKRAFGDDKLMDDLKKDAKLKAVPVSLFDMLSGGIAGKIAGRAGKGIIKKTLANTGEVLVQAGLGGAGEAAGQIASEGKVSSPNAIVMEMIGETGPGSVEIATGTMMETYKRGREASTKDAVTIVAKANPTQVNNTIDANIASGNLTPEQGAKLKTKISQTQADIKKVPEDLSDAAKAEAIDLIKKKDALVEQSKNLDPAFKPEADKQIKDLESQILGVVEKDRKASTVDLPEVTVTGVKKKATDLPEVTVAAGKKLFNEPNPETKVIATEYKQAKGIDIPEGAPITKVDENKSKSIADAYDAMENNPNDPEVKASYEAMAKETKEQYDAITKSGVKFEIFEGEGEPYKNSEEMIKDVRDNKHLFVLSTDKDFGQNPITDQQRNDNPLLRDSGAKDINGKPLLMNDVFRGVHDFFGHTERGNSFGAVGEENAWDVHARMFTPLARRAMTTETRGQNSWVNFGKQMRNPDGSIKKKGDEGFMSATERPFAEQKIGLLPEEFSNIEDNSTMKSPKFEVTATTPVDLPNVTVKSPIHKKVIADVNQAAKTLASSGIKFKIYDNAESFATESGQDKSTQGVFVDEDGTVSINLDAIKNSKDWNIAWHESSHPVMNIIRNTNKPLYDKMAKGLSDLAKTDKNAAAIVNWSENNYEGKETQVDEAVVESIALMADGTIDFDNVPLGTRQALIDFINEIAKYLGLDPILSDTSKATFIKKAKEISNALKTGTDISTVVGDKNVSEFKNNIGENVGEPTQLRVSDPNQGPVEFKPSYPLSFVKPEDKIDIKSLIDDIQAKGQKVWFWVADQLGRGNYYDSVIDGEHYLDAGPSFALDPENRKQNVIWATGKGEKFINDNIKKSDYLFIISGSPLKSKLFNKKVADITIQRLKGIFKDDYAKFKAKMNSVSKITGLNNIINEFNSFEELLDSPKRKDFLIAIDDQKEKKGTDLKKFLDENKLFVDYESLRDGFYKDNGFDMNDIMLVLKPTKMGGVSKHSTYQNNVLGDVVGVPDKKINAYDIMTPEFRAKYPELKSKTQQSQTVAPYGSGIKGVASPIKETVVGLPDVTVTSTKKQQKVGKVELPAATQKQMTEDDKGNYLFYHYSDKNIKTIDPSKFGSNTRATGRDERPGVGISMYYTRPDVKEQNVPSEFGYVVRVPKGKVYPFNQDPLNLIEPAKRMFEKQFPGQAFDPNKQVAWVSKAAAGRGYPMTVAEWNIGRRKLVRAQTTEALKPEVFTKIKPGTLNQVETNPALDKFKPNAKKRGQAKIGGGVTLEDLKDYNSLPNVEMAAGNNYVPLSKFGITTLEGENVKSVAAKLAEAEGPYQPIFRAISTMPDADKVKMYDLGETVNIYNQSGGMVAGLYSPAKGLFGKPQIGVATDIYANQYSAIAHEMMHWVTIDSINKYKNTPEYKSIENIYNFLKAKHPDIVGSKASGSYYGLQNFKEFMAELLTNKDFRDNMAGVMAKDAKEFERTAYRYKSESGADNTDLITQLVRYVTRVIKDMMDTWGKKSGNIDFSKPLIDNATDLAVKAFFADKSGGPQLSMGGANIDADTRKSVANMLDKLSDEDIAKILMDEKGLTEEEATALIEDVKYDPSLNPSVGDIVGEVGEGERARGLSKTFPDRGVDTISKINDDAKKYFVISNKQTAEEAQAFIDEKNPEDALDYLLTQPTDIPNRVRIWMSGAVMDKIDTAINEAQLKGDKETAQRLSNKQAQLVNQVAPLGTELGQAIQAFRRFYENSKGSPSMLQFYIKKITDQVESEKGKPLTDEERQNIVDLAKNVQSADEGLPKDEATYALGNYVSTITPVASTDIMEAIWYAHILSGITTQSTNFFANLWNSFAEGAVVGTREAIKNKSVMPFLNGIKGFLSGIKQGANDAADIIKTGVTKQDGDKFRQGNILEFFSWKQVVGNKAGKVLDWAGGYSPKILKYVGRALAATDAAFSRANSEAISRVMAYNIAQEEGKTNPDLKINKRVDELLNKTAEKKAEAQEKAKAEGYLEGTTRYRRRVGEIMEAGRSKELRKEADEFGKRVTLNYEPEGFMRPVYKLALALQQSTKLTRMFIAFTRIVVNLTENALNYTPLGFVKTAVGSTTTDTTLKGNVRRKLTPDERADFAIKATIGLSTFVLLSGLTGEDDDDLFEITANGSGNKQKNYELMKSGWRPYSIKTKDGRYISYKDWPIAPVLAAVGAMHDSGKYNSSDEPTNEATIAAQAMVVSLYDKSVMKGLQDFVEIIDPKEEYNQSTKMFDRLKNWGADQARTMAVSNFTQQAFKFASEAMDNPIKASRGVERIYRDIPYLNDGLNPILDVFGEPVKPSTSERLLPITLGKPSKDEILAALNENGVYIGKPKTRPLFLTSDPSNEETRPMTDQEYYQFTKRSGQITKQIIMEEWDEIKKILAITDKKKRRAELKDYMSKLIGDAREEAFYEFPNQE